MKTVASTTFTSSSKQRKVNFFSSPFSRYCTAKKILAIGVNTRVFVLFYGLIRRACKFSVNFTVNRLNAFVYTLGIKRRHMKTVASTTFTSSSKQRKVNFFSSPFSRYCTAKKILAIGVNTRVFVLFYGLIRRACKFSVNFYGSCKDHFKPLFNPPPISSFSWSLKTHFIGSFRYFIIYFCMYKIISKTPLEGDEKNYCSRSK